MRKIFFLVYVIIYASLSGYSQSVPSPKEHFGFAIGDDYQLANYSQTEAYFKKLAAASDRVKLVDIGPTEEGRRQYMVIVSSPANLKDLDRYQSISQTLAHAGVDEAHAKAMAAEGKAVVWIDGGLHATETVGTHQLIETMYQFASRTDAETMRILNDVIILFVHANPDGQELVSNWYMRESKPEKRSYNNLPRLYQKYIGHDNNRDFYMLNMKESQNISRQQYIEWMPQIIYNHHQEGPPGSVVAGPPYRDPFNFAYDPLLVTSIDAVGAAMNNRLNAEGKPGYTQRQGSSFSTWWNGGLRTTAYFHNMVGLLTEIIGRPFPTQIPLVPERLIPNSATPNPVTPQVWRFRQSIDYSVSLNYAVLDYASRNKEHLLFNSYRMGRNSIEKGSRDNWTLSPWLVDSVSNAYRKDNKGEKGSDTLPSRYYTMVLKDPGLRDARAYILPAGGPDFATSVQFVNALIRSGIQVHKATAPFAVEGKRYPAGSYVIKTAQAFRPHVIDLFEPQYHPNDFQYPGGPPVRPYDAAGWTLAYTMGIKFDRVLNSIDAPLQAIPYGEVQQPQGHINASGGTAGYLLPAQANASFAAVNDLLKAGFEVYRLTEVLQGTANAVPGAFFVPYSARAKGVVEDAANRLGLEVATLSKRPAALSKKLAPLRIALWDAYGGSISSGWTRWILEQYRFPFEVVYAPVINAGNLRSKYDVIVFPNGAIPMGAQGGRGAARGPNPGDIPAEYRSMIGAITPDTSVARLKQFLQAGGTVVAIGSSANLAYQLNLPVSNALVEMVDGKERPVPREKFYIPGSVLRARIDSTRGVSWGMPSEGDIYFDNSPVFTLAPDAGSRGGVKPLMWFNSEKVLRSGWAWGQAYLQNGVTAFEAPLGKGTLYAFGPEITFRGQTHGTFKLLFNTLYSSVE